MKFRHNFLIDLDMLFKYYIKAIAQTGISGGVLK